MLGSRNNFQITDALPTSPRVRSRVLMIKMMINHRSKIRTPKFGKTNLMVLYIKVNDGMINNGKVKLRTKHLIQNIKIPMSIIDEVHNGDCNMFQVHINESRLKSERSFKAPRIKPERSTIRI